MARSRVLHFGKTDVHLRPPVLYGYGFSVLQGTGLHESESASVRLSDRPEEDSPDSGQTLFLALPTRKYRRRPTPLAACSLAIRVSRIT